MLHIHVYMYGSQRPARARNTRIQYSGLAPEILSFFLLALPIPMVGQTQSYDAQVACACHDDDRNTLESRLGRVFRQQQFEPHVRRHLFESRVDSLHMLEEYPSDMNMTPTPVPSFLQLPRNGNEPAS